MKKIIGPDWLAFPIPDVLISGILFLFFFQLLSDFIASIYAIALLRVSLTVEIISALLLLSPAILIFVPLRSNRTVLKYTGFLVILTGLLEIGLSTRGKMFVAGFGVACFLIYLVLWILYRSPHPASQRAQVSGAGLVLALALSIVLRTPGSGNPGSVVGETSLSWWLLGVLAGIFILVKPEPAYESDTPNPGSGKKLAGPLKMTGLSLGISGVLLLGYFAFSAPNVIARWTDASYPPVILMPVASLAFFLGLALCSRKFWSWVTPPLLFAWNGIFTISLVGLIASNQVLLPPTSNAYPILAPSVPTLSFIFLILTLFLFPVIVIDFSLFTRELMDALPARRPLASAFTLAALFFLLMIFAQVFTATYDYIPVIGPIFRDKLWLVFLLAAISAWLPLILVSKSRYIFHPISINPGLLLLAVLCLPILSVGGDLQSSASRPGIPIDQTTLRVLTYNLQQGYSADGEINFTGQVNLIKKIDSQTRVDILGLQESDTARIANGNTDIVRYFADQLDLYSYYGPKTVTGTFGIALLSRFPILNPNTYYLYSSGEQTAVIVAQVQVGAKTFTILVTHLGNGGPLIQQQEVLGFAQAKENLILMGDFNFVSTTPQYQLTAGILDDAWLQGGSHIQDGAAFDPTDRIDYIFSSHQLHINSSTFYAGPESDHPALVSDFNW